MRGRKLTWKNKNQLTKGKSLGVFVGDRNELNEINDN